MVHSTCRAPACTAAIELATAIPRSSWQCADSIAAVADAFADGREHPADVFGQRVADGVGQIDRRRARVDDGVGDVAEERRDRVRVASSAENSTSSANVRAGRPPPRLVRGTAPRSMRSLSRR